MAKSDLARRLQKRLTELDVVLQELGRVGRVKLFVGLKMDDEYQPSQLHSLG